MTIQRWEPFRDTVSLRDAMNSLLQDSFVRPMSLLADGATTLPLDISENKDEFIVKASLPGVRPEDVHITAQRDTRRSAARSRPRRRRRTRTITSASGGMASSSAR
jgi:HSP20 family protein